MNLRVVGWDGSLRLAILPAAGAAHGRDLLVECAPAIQVLLDGAVAVPSIHFH